MIVACAALAAAAHAEDNAKHADAPAQAGSASRQVCIDAEVNGQRALSYDCLSAQLKPKEAPRAGASETAAESAAKGPSNRVGTFNLSAERNRFGTNWGKSITPQRPAQPVVVPPR
ncbi:hypothetical protein C9I57_01080 [Trinickia symbiotica]|uniref:Uncharacterized protein n=2 Tax=Trinickia symbiotica TaxID=863227 RepID=A0A2T3Y242_9BURK|nr:hypothetical protein C9I57_01080 [Trinickia symbiotica]